jgi:predicted DsbA family dithiol-disulfide isomerase
VRLDELKHRFGDRIDVTWRAFLLRTETKATDQAKFVAYTESWRRPAAAEPAATFTVWSTDETQPTSSVPAHVAAKSLATMAPDAADAFHHRLLRAYFAENRTISDWAVLGDLAADVGVDRARFLRETAARERELTEAVIAEHDEAVAQGITAVPTMVIDEVLPVQGAQDVDTLARWIERLLDRRLGGS